MENLGKVTMFGIIIVVSFCISLLSATIIDSIAYLYKLELINSLSFVQIYGFMIIIAIFKFKYKKSEDVGFNKSVKDVFIKQSAYVFMLLGTWGLSFLIYNILV